MTTAHEPLQPGFVRMIHPPTGNIADVAVGAEGLHYAAGWTLLTADNMPQDDAPADPPVPMTEDEAATAREGGEQAKDDGGQEKAGEQAKAGARRRATANTEE